jgi:sterol desaturase/sphingolipid hydroxylase (fatty acid hydroxylase superfamily)
MLRSLSWAFWGYSGFIFIFYHVTNAVIQWLFYHRRKSETSLWRAQPEKPKVGKSSDPFVPWIPILEPLLGIRQPGAEQYPRGWLLCTINTLVASLFAGIVAETAMRGGTKLYYDAIPELAFGKSTAAFWLAIVGEFLLITFHESVVEYVWHWAMHRPFLYKRFHKIHHHNKSPGPFNDMLIHPLEAIGYYCILYSPPFLYRIHWLSFFAYMSIMGLFGVIDHCGVKISIPWIYDSEFHDLHHEKFHPNLGFPFAFMDVIFGTKKTKADYHEKKKKVEAPTLKEASLESSGSSKDPQRNAKQHERISASRSPSVGKRSPGGSRKRQASKAR